MIKLTRRIRYILTPRVLGRPISLKLYLDSYNICIFSDFYCFLYKKQQKREIQKIFRIWRGSKN